MAYEYKCVGAPERAKRKRGARTRTDRVAHAMQDVINAEAVDGWEYQRTDLLPIEEKAGLFSRTQEVHRAILVFRRGSSDTAQIATPQPGAANAMPQPVTAPVRPDPATSTPSLQTSPDTPDRDEPIRLAAETDAKPAPASQSIRAPKGLS